MGSGADTPTAASDWERQIKGQIRRRYATLNFPPDGAGRAREAGYPADLIETTPDWLTASYSGCGFLLDELSLTGTETVVDLGCGTGVDSFLISRMLNDGGLVLAIDMTREMLARIGELPTDNITPLAGDMECLPLADETVDQAVANASFNLTLNKRNAFAEAFRVLKGGGRLVACDLVKDGDLPPEVLTDPLSYNTSLGGAIEEDDLKEIILETGFESVAITGHRPFSAVTAVKITAQK